MAHLTSKKGLDRALGDTSIQKGERSGQAVAVALETHEQRAMCGTRSRGVIERGGQGKGQRCKREGDCVLIVPRHVSNQSPDLARESELRVQKGVSDAIGILSLCHARKGAGAPRGLD